MEEWPDDKRACQMWPGMDRGPSLGERVVGEGGTEFRGWPAHAFPGQGTARLRPEGGERTIQ